jgi:hypothetical protein
MKSYFKSCINKSSKKMKSFRNSTANSEHNIPTYSMKVIVTSTDTG